jgi:hypothetical protein
MTLLSDRAFALTFFAGRQDLAAATRTGIFMISNIGGGNAGGTAATSTLYQSQKSLTTLGPAPSGLGISTDNQRLVMADSAGGVLSLNLSSGLATETSCGCVPEGVLSMGGTLFRITGLTSSVFRMFDAGSNSVFLAPLAPGAAPGDGSSGPIRSPIKGFQPAGGQK